MTVPRDDQHELLREYIVAALYDQKDADLALRIAAHLDAGRFDVMSRFDLDDDDQPDPKSLTYVVVVEVSDGRAQLCAVHYTRLGVSDDEAVMELQAILAQHGVGIPDDVSELDTP